MRFFDTFLASSSALALAAAAATQQMSALYEQLATITAALELEKSKTREVQLRMHGEVVHAMTERESAITETKQGNQQEIELLRAALAGEKARARETVGHLQSEKTQMKTQIAQLKGEIEVQTLVIERTEEVIREKHRLASENKRLQGEVLREQQRSRDTEHKLLGEIEILMSTLPGSRNPSRARTPAGASAAPSAAQSAAPSAATTPRRGVRLWCFRGVSAAATQLAQALCSLARR